jgi:hypothetical protein
LLLWRLFVPSKYREFALYQAKKRLKMGNSHSNPSADKYSSGGPETAYLLSWNQKSYHKSYQKHDTTI